MGCKKQGAKKGVIVIQKEKRPLQGHKPTHVFKTRIVGAD